MRYRGYMIVWEWTQYLIVNPNGEESARVATFKEAKEFIDTLEGV